MSFLSKIVILFCSILVWDVDVKAQQGTYNKYDSKLITPNLRGRSSISLGIVAAINRPLPDQDIKVEPSFHIGYNYLILEQRKLRFSKKNKSKEEIKMSFGTHLTLSVGGEVILNANYYRPFIAIGGRILRWFLFSEYGIGLHRFPDYYQVEKKWTPNLSLETFRIQFLKSRFIFNHTLNLDLRNNYLSKKRANWGMLFALRYYI